MEIQVAGSQIEGSPFYVDVFDLNSIRIDNFRHGIVGEDAGFSGEFDLWPLPSWILMFTDVASKYFSYLSVQIQLGI